jgi:Ca2+-binding RTX toxin-like protein/GH24 family phage-related lysozyme (muramidase)
MIRFRTISPASLFNALYSFFVNAEGKILSVHDDGMGIPTIGVGMNLKANPDVRKQVADTIFGKLPSSTSPLFSIEQGYRTQIQNAASATYSGASKAARTSAMRTAFDAIAARRANDVRLVSIVGKRKTFAFTSETEMKATAQRVVEDIYQRLLTSRLNTVSAGSVPISTERLALLSMFWNGPTTIGNGLGQALKNGNRANAWYEIRYRSNPDRPTVTNNESIRQGLAKRRYFESDWFAIYNNATQVTLEEAHQVFAMYALNRTLIDAYEKKFGGQVAAADRDYGTGIANAQTRTEAFAPALAVMKATYEYTKNITEAMVVPADNTTANLVLTGGDTADLMVQLAPVVATFDGGKGNDVLLGGVKADVLTGGEGNDVLVGLAENDTLTGGAGVDILRGDVGNDILAGNTDRDAVLGFDGNDTYHFTLGDGQDAFSDGWQYTWDAEEQSAKWQRSSGFMNRGNDVIHLGAGLTRDKIRFELSLRDGIVGPDLLIWFKDLPDYIYIPDQLYAPIELVRFNDGSTMKVAYVKDLPPEKIKTRAGEGLTQISGTLLDDVLQSNNQASSLSGNEGNDRVIGGLGNDTLRGGVGNDTVWGAAGNDTYLFGRGDGSDTIYETAGQDTLKLSSNVAYDQLWFRRSGSDLLVSIIGTRDSIRIGDWYGTPTARIENIMAGEHVLVEKAVQAIVEGMSAFNPPAEGQLILPPDYHKGLDGIIAAVWT